MSLGTATPIRCPRCGKTREVSFICYSHYHCPCGNNFTALLKNGFLIYDLANSIEIDHEAKENFENWIKNGQKVIGPISF